MTYQVTAYDPAAGARVVVREQPWRPTEGEMLALFRVCSRLGLTRVRVTRANIPMAA